MKKYPYFWYNVLWKKIGIEVGKSELGLRQLLNSSEKEIENSKLVLCGYGEEEGDYFYNIWKDSNETKVSFAYSNSEKNIIIHLDRLFSVLHKFLKIIAIGY